MSNSTSNDPNTSFEIIKSYILSSTSIMFIIVGTTSFLFNILLFTRPRIWRQSPCIPYLLASTIANIPGIYSTILTRALAGFQLTPTYNSLFLCKLVAYVSNTSYALSTWFMVACCWDRYLSSSSVVTTRRLSNVRTTRQVMFVITFVILTVYICKLYCYEIGITLTASSCSNKDSLCNTVDVCITFSVQFIAPLVLLVHFGIATLFNVRRFSRRQHANLNTVVPVIPRRVITAKDQSVLRVVLVQVGLMVICLSPLIIFRIYQLVPLTFVKSSMRLSVESFLFSMLLLLSNIDKVFSFYIYTLASSHFRKEFKRLLYSLYRRNGVIPFN
jgi:hypothetical protein